MTIEIEMIPLRFEDAYRYATEQLRDGHALAQAVLKQVDFKKGHFCTLIHPSADRNKIYTFRTGGILPANPLESIQFNEKSYPGRKKAHSVPQLAEYLRKIMHPGLCCVFDDMVHSKSDPIIPEMQKQILYFREDVYFYLKGIEFSTDIAERMIQYSDAQWYYMNIISEEAVGTSRDLTEDKLQRIVAKTAYIVFGAYDMEGYVVWTER